MRLNFEKKVIIWSLISRAGAIKMSEVWRGAGGGGTLLTSAPLHHSTVLVFVAG